MNYLDTLPTEILHTIAQDSEPAYLALITAYPRFAREVTPGRRLDYMVAFGHDVKSLKFDIGAGAAPVYFTVWYRNNVVHRINQPAVESDTGSKAWYWRGKQHRDNAPAYTDANITMWYQHGELHREDGPAFVDERSKRWYQHDKPHRADGPAIMRTDGTAEWWVDGVKQPDNDANNK